MLAVPGTGTVPALIEDDTGTGTCLGPADFFLNSSIISSNPADFLPYPEFYYKKKMVRNLLKFFVSELNELINDFTVSENTGTGTRVL
jgi:hypothetical protein